MSKTHTFSYSSYLILIILLFCIPLQYAAEPVDSKCGNCAIPVHVYEAAHDATFAVTIKSLTDQDDFEVGTAFVVHPSGILLTCNHVARKGTQGHVTHSQLGELPCVVVGRIPQTDIAILKTTHSANFKPVNWQSSVSLNLSMPVFTIANFYNRNFYTIRGFLAARENCVFMESVAVENALALDMPVAGGASGAAVCNADGNVIGMVMGWSRDCSMLTTVNPAEQIAESIVETFTPRGLFGHDFGFTTASRECFSVPFIDGICHDSPAAKNGLAIGDEIIAVGPWTVRNHIDLSLSIFAWFSEHKDQPLPLTLCNSNGEKRTVSLTPDYVPFTPDTLDNSEVIAAGNVSRSDTAFLSQKLSSGYISIPQDGSYVFYLAVPGTGKFTIGKDFQIEKRLAYPPMRVAGRGFFRKGFYTFSLEQDCADTTTTPLLLVELPNTFTPPQSNIPIPIPAEWLFVVPTSSASLFPQD
ncbi:MAG: trypsin-like peptidase domain-containing protein [Thermoguttaceae bacterium]